MSIKSHGSSIFQYGDTFHFLYRQTVDRTLHSINKNQYVFLASRLDATDVKRCTTSFLTLETSVLEGIQARELAI